MVQTWVMEKHILGTLCLFLAHTVEFFLNLRLMDPEYAKHLDLYLVKSHQMTCGNYLCVLDLSKMQAKLIDQVLTEWSVNPASFAAPFFQVFKWFSVW